MQSVFLLSGSLVYREILLEIEDVDIVDGTPLLDIKPYVPAFGSHCDAKAGWFDAVSNNATSLR